MKLPVHLLSLFAALVLLLLAVPFALVKLDVLDARWLELIPSAIAVILALLAIFAVRGLWRGAAK